MSFSLTVLIFYIVLKSRIRNKWSNIALQQSHAQSILHILIVILTHKSPFLYTLFILARNICSKPSHTSASIVVGIYCPLVVTGIDDT